MTNNSAPFVRRHRPVLLAALALGLAAGTSAALAQDQPAAAREPVPAPSRGAAGPSAPSDVEEVTVNAPRVRPENLAVSPEKRAALDAEAAQDQAWRDYRRSTPPLTSDPNDLSKDFPGLQTYLPK